MVYRCEVYENIRADGVFVSIRAGQEVNVDGEQWVRSMSGQLCERMDANWWESRHDAKRAAAHKVQQFADLLAAQAKWLRQEADREQAAEEVANGVA